MAKTDPIGVRFRREILDHMKEHFGVETPQSGLVFMENFYRQYWDKVSVLDVLGEEKPKEEVNFTKKYKQIEALLIELRAAKEEKIPSNRDTPLGKQSWQIDQNKKILSLQTQIFNFQ